MKKIFKSCLLVLVAICVSFSFVGCKKKLSETTVNTDSVKYSNGKTTNGGMTVVKDNYLYFINGTKENNGKSQKKNKRSAICRVKYNIETGETSGDMEVVVDELVGFVDSTLHIFGDFLYYTTPCSGENSKGEILYNRTVFKRYDLVSKRTQTLYTTELNSSSEELKYAYYVVGESLNLLVYEKTVGTIKSFKIDKKVKENYVIEDVASCLLSENYGIVTTKNATVDANTFVFYSKYPGSFEYPQTGVKIYKTSPVTDNSSEISKGKEITLLSIQAGKLVYSCNEFIYANAITAGTDTLQTDKTNCISWVTLEGSIYLENYKLIKNPSDETKHQLVRSEGDIAVLAFTKSTDKAYYFSIFDWQGGEQGPSFSTSPITTLTSSKDFNFIGLTEMDVIVVEDNEETEDVNEEKKEKVLYALFMDTNIVYKLEVARYSESDESVLNVSVEERIQLSTSKVNINEGLLLPELIGTNLFILSEDTDKNDYLIKIDVTPEKNVTKESSKFALEEK